MELAIRNKYIILTFDKDFGELVFKDYLDKPIGIVLFRLKDDLPEDAGLKLISIIEVEKLSLEDHFTVIEDTKVRQRKY